LTGIRDRTILEVFYSTGIRLEELVSLTIYDCDLTGQCLRINKGKGAKDRVVPLGRHAARLLKEYLSRIRPRSVHNRSLFLNRSGEPLSKQVIQLMVRTYAKQAGITKKVTPHIFRHSFATSLLKNGADIIAVQKMLGHVSPKTTQIYTHVAGVEIKQTHSHAHPREKDKPDDPAPPQTKKRYLRARPR
jgi:integrase/recombinase XerD